jgi:hypothetical protein
LYTGIITDIKSEKRRLVVLLFALSFLLAVYVFFSIVMEALAVAAAVIVDATTGIVDEADGFL